MPRNCAKIQNLVSSCKTVQSYTDKKLTYIQLCARKCKIPGAASHSRCMHLNATLQYTQPIDMISWKKVPEHTEDVDKSPESSLNTTAKELAQQISNYTVAHKNAADSLVILQALWDVVKSMRHIKGGICQSQVSAWNQAEDQFRNSWQNPR